MFDIFTLIKYSAKKHIVSQALNNQGRKATMLMQFLTYSSNELLELVL